MAQVLTFEKTEGAPSRYPDWFVETPTGQDIMRSLRIPQAMEGGAATMIAGAPGVGKTQALKAFSTDPASNATYVQAIMGEPSPYALAIGILRACGHYVGEFPGCGVTELRQKVSWFVGQGRTLIVDEAQYLDAPTKNGPRGAALEWLRGVAETTGCHLVLAGDLKLERAVARFPQLMSRMRRPVVVKRCAKGDVAAVAGKAGVTDPAAIDVLAAVARRDGALRTVDNVLRVARLFAGEAPVQGAHVKAAVADLGLAPKGGRA